MPSLRQDSASLQPRRSRSAMGNGRRFPLATVQTACRVSALALCDRRHKLPFDYLIKIFGRRVRSRGFARWETPMSAAISGNGEPKDGNSLSVDQNNRLETGCQKGAPILRQALWVSSWSDKRYHAMNYRLEFVERRKRICKIFSARSAAIASPIATPTAGGEARSSLR
jgi:hypothetical protein